MPLSRIQNWDLSRYIETINHRLDSNLERFSHIQNHLRDLQLQIQELKEIITSQQKQIRLLSEKIEILEDPREITRILTPLQTKQNP